MMDVAGAMEMKCEIQKDVRGGEIAEKEGKMNAVMGEMDVEEGELNCTVQR